jgi:hypothetical protein
MWDFLQEHWAVAALILSEVLAFIPSKFSGIAQSIVSILNAIFSKSTESENKSAKS